MFKILLSLLLLLKITIVYATIFGTDDRQEFFEMPIEHQKIAQASIALIPKSKLTRKGNKFLVSYKSLEVSLNMCADSLFAKQPLGANCSGALIEGNRILTAAHCIDEKTIGRGKDDFYVVFNYKAKDSFQTDFYISEDDVFKLNQEIFHRFDMPYDIDLAVYKLDRPAAYTPMKISYQPPVLGESVSTIGYPLGVAMKLSSESVVSKILPRTHAFRHTLDTFAVNSGSPILNSKLQIVGVHVRGTGMNIEKLGRDCFDWAIGDYDRDYGEANNLGILKPYDHYNGQN